MKIHGNAGLTIAQRELIQKLFASGGVNKSELARRFGVNRKTINRWTNRQSPKDHKSGPKTPYTVITAEYRESVLAYRRKNEDHGPVTIAFHLKKEFPFANRGTVQRILKKEKLTIQSRVKEKKDPTSGRKT